MERKRNIKPFEELTIVDDYMFCKVMQLNPEICRHLLEIILNVKIEKVEFISSQKNIDITPSGRGIRLDVYVADEKHTIYDIEMQTTNKHDIPLRARYYQGMIDLECIEKGTLFKNLKKSIVIFICPFDLFGKHRPVYIFENRCVDDEFLKFGDITEKVIVNLTAREFADNSEELRALCYYFMTGNATNAYTETIEKNVCTIRTGEKWRTDYMTLGMKYAEIAEEAREEGIKIGMEAGIEKGIEKGTLIGMQQGERNALLQLVKDNLITVEIAAKRLNMPENEISYLVAKI